MTACVERSLVITSGPGVISGPDTDHSGLHPIAEFACRPNFQIRIDAEIDVTQQIFAGIGGRVVRLLEWIESRAAPGH